MEKSIASPQAPSFITQNTPQLISRYALSYRHEFSCVDYYIDDVKTGARISKEILFTLDRVENRIVVSRFYPELCRKADSKYLSATSFYLMIHHFKHLLEVPPDFHIYLTAKPSIFVNFYEKLKDFEFYVHGSKKEKYWEVISSISSKTVDTSTIQVNTKITVDKTGGKG